MKSIQLTNNSQSVSFTKTRIPGRLKRDLILIGMGLIIKSNDIAYTESFWRNSSGRSRRRLSFIYTRKSLILTFIEK